MFAGCVSNVPAFLRESRCLMVCANVNAEFGIAQLTRESSCIVIMQQIVHEWMDHPEPFFFLPS